MEPRIAAISVVVIIASASVLILSSGLIGMPSPASSDAFQLVEEFPNLTFDRPLGLQDPGDDSNRLFVVEQTGKILVFENSASVTNSTVFLDLSDKITKSNIRGNEEGLLGLAFHPDYGNDGTFFVDYTADTPRRTVIARYSVSAANPDVADPSSERIILEVEQPYQNHNGGQLQFGPDGYLYIGMGDGGSGGDPQGNGQNLSTLLGAILRINIDMSGPGSNYSIPQDNPFAGNSKGYREEIYAYGLRNPWRFSFDSQTGDLWVGDVGQDAIEEIDVIEAGGNYGWNIKEGTACYNPVLGCNDTGLINPVAEYNHSVGECIIGGFVYRGEAVPLLVGYYIYADFMSGRIWSLKYDGGTVVENNKLFDSGLSISSFGIDAQNKLLILAFDGKIRSIHQMNTGTSTETTTPAETSSTPPTGPTTPIETSPTPSTAPTDFWVVGEVLIVLGLCSAVTMAIALLKRQRSQ
jgi:glucose/arabinose dehydrogenase